MESIGLDAYIVRTLMRDLIGHDHKPTAFVVYLWLATESERTGGKITISYAALAGETGLSRSAAQSAVAWLIQRELLSVTHASATATPEYLVLRPWRQRRR